VDVVGSPEPVPALERIEEAGAFDHRRGNAEADERQPSDRGQDVEEDECREWQEDEQADEERPDKAAPLHGSPGDDHGGAHVREGHERYPDGETDDLLGPTV
jgi:hypothetical protein